jgi:Ca2+-binding RTX toxin-like protein
MMTTYTLSGFSRRVDYAGPTLYVDYSHATLTIVRQDGDGAFTYGYGFIDATGTMPKFSDIFDPWSGSAELRRLADGAVQQLTGSGMHLETQVVAVTWAPGQTAYVLRTFSAPSGHEHLFFIGGAVPQIASLDALNAFLALPTDYILSGPFEGGNAIPLAQMPGVTVTEADLLIAAPDDPILWDGGAGNDTITGSAEGDTILGGAGDDVLTGGGGYDRIWGAEGNDTITTSGESFAVISGGAGDDSLSGGSSFGDMIQGGAGNDRIQLSNGRQMGEMWISHSVAQGGSGDDTITGGLGGDAASGGVGNDVLAGGGGDDRLTGDAGNDTLLGGAGQDTVEGGDWADSLSGEAGNDVLIGGVGRDTLLGGDGNDVLRGEGGNDSLVGGTGADTLIGGAGADTLAGQGGADVFLYLAAADSAGTGRDSIWGFQAGVDDIDLTEVFAGTLVWQGTAAFSGTGQVRSVVAGGNSYLTVNLAGDATPEMSVVVMGVTIGAGDVIL